MSRVVSVFALILMLLTGLALGKMTSLGEKPVRIAATSDSGAAETARAFYAAINLFLESGDAQALKQFLPPGFVGHAPHLAGHESAEEFFQYLESVRSTFPGLQLEVSDLSAQAGTVAMDVTLTGNTAGSFGGLPLDAGSGTSGYEVLRVEDEQIVERWASLELPPLYQAMISVAIPIPAGIIPEPSVDRLVFDPNGAGEFVDHDGFILFAESEAVTFQIVSYPDAAADPATTLQMLGSRPSLPEEGSSVELAPGESIVVPPGVRFRMANDGSGSASVLIISIRQAQSGMVNLVPYDVIESIGLERIFLAGGGTNRLNNEEDIWTVAVGQLVLPPGVSIPRHHVDDVELLVVVEGVVDVTVHHGSLTWNQPGKSFVVVDDKQIISAGQGAQANPGTVVDYRASGDEPATLWIVTIQSDDPQAPNDE